MLAVFQNYLIVAGQLLTNKGKLSREGYFITGTIVLNAGNVLSYFAILVHYQYVL